MFTTQLADTLRARRSAHLSHQRMVRELAAYTSPTDIDDLTAILDTHPEEEVAEIRAILLRQRAA
jgi:hypothetical protein